MRRSPQLLAVVVVLCAAPTLAHPSEDPSERLSLTQQEDAQPAQVEKYPDVAGIDIVADAPWRVDREHGAIPVLVFVPDANLDEDGFVGLRLRRVTIFANGERVFQDTDATEPDGRGVWVVDEFGNRVSNDLAGAAAACGERAARCDVGRPGGWHRIVHIPLAGPATYGDVYLRVEVVAEAAYEGQRAVSPSRRWFFARTLKVQVAANPLPSLGSGWQYYDAHFHSIAEWSQGTKLLAPRKAFGGPVQMVKESAAAMGLAPGPDEVRNRVVVTDHNAFFSDAETIPVGPTSLSRAEGERRPDRFPEAVGQREFEAMRAIFGDSFGEEVTLKTRLRSGGLNFGSHLLMMRADHFDGPWHGGLLWLSLWNFQLGKLFGGEPNPNTLDRVLGDAASQGSRPFAYAAHPFGTGNHWTDGGENDLEILHDRTRRYVTKDDFVMKGAQYWNGKGDEELEVERRIGNQVVRAVDFFDLHPFPGAPTAPLPPEAAEGFVPKSSYPAFRPNPGWDDELNKGLADWHARIRRLLQFSFEDDPEVVFPRKLYLYGGSDAHGDFNFETSLLATVLDRALLREAHLSRRSVTSNAFAKVRTYVDGRTKTASNGSHAALDALSDGNACVTDGPVVSLFVDADARFDSATLGWDAARAVPNGDPDGRMGGDGAFDGGFTALVANRGEHAVLHYEWANSGEFGPAFGGAPGELEIYVDRASGASPPSAGEANGLHPRVADLRPHWTLRDPPGRAAAIDLGDMQLAVDEPMALSMAIFTRKRTGEEFRGYTNPVWLIPVEATVALATDRAGPVEPGALTAELRFGMSMHPTEDPKVSLRSIGRDGLLRSQVELQVVNRGPVERSGARGRIANARFRLTNPGEIARPEPGGRLLLVVHGPLDAHGNRLNPVAVPLDP